MNKEKLLEAKRGSDPIIFKYDSTTSTYTEVNQKLIVAENKIRSLEKVVDNILIKLNFFLENAYNNGVNQKDIFLQQLNNLQHFLYYLFLLPSLFEGLPVVLVETQAVGLPSVVSREAVPQETCVYPGFINYVSLSDSLDEWADEVIKSYKPIIPRETWIEKLSASKFNIDKEALRLEGILGL